MEETELLISVCMITFNHEKYISDAIEGVLMQETNFLIELVIGEDCSTDNTRKICLDYKSKYPDIIKLRLPKKNLGMIPNLIENLKACEGKYIALCEGDDRWIDPLKLQKQVSFLEANPDYGLIYSDIRMIDQDGQEISLTPFYENKKCRYSGGDVFWELLSGNFINTLTICVRKEYIADYLSKYPAEWFMYDYRLWLHVAQRSKVKFMYEKTACYRIHSQSISKSPGFFHKRISLSKLSALHDYYKYNKHVNFTSHNRYILGKTLWSIIKNNKLSYKEKSSVWHLLLKNRANGLKSLIKLLSLKVIKMF